MGEAQDVQTLSGRYDPLADEEWNGSIVESMARITYRIGGIEAMRLLLTPGRAAGYTRVGAAKVLSEVAGVSALPLLEESLMTETEVEVADAIGVAILRICQREECLDEVVSISERTQKPTVASAFMLEYANV
ncbi:MAG: hypothetical protein HQ596_08660 [Candidatus Saganbacteria bacterium]|nr:hypothetical protein [Candidatus Saganbacteria bacterium]